MKILLNDEQITKYRAGMNQGRLVEEVAIGIGALDHVYGYGIRTSGIIEEDGVLYAVWSIWDSCD